MNRLLEEMNGLREHHKKLTAQLQEEKTVAMDTVKKELTKKVSEVEEECASLRQQVEQNKHKEEVLFQENAKLKKEASGMVWVWLLMGVSHHE